MILYTTSAMQQKNQGVKKSYFGQSRFSFSFCMLCLRLVIHTSTNSNTCPSSANQKIELQYYMQQKLIFKQNKNVYVNCRRWHSGLKKSQCLQEMLPFKYVNPIRIPHDHNNIQNKWQNRNQPAHVKYIQADWRDESKHYQEQIITLTK